MMNYRLEGLIAACCTPLKSDGSLNLEAVPLLVDHYRMSGVSGLYICGSTGEGVSLTCEERRATAEAFISASTGDMVTLINVSHNSVREACDLAEHARLAGADVISATLPVYFDIDSPELAINTIAEVASGASDLPFYYYHFPSRTRSSLDLRSFLEAVGDKVPNLCGVKYTSPALHEYQSCMDIAGGRFDMVWGLDEMLLGALTAGARSAIGSTYNIAAPAYLRLFQHFERGELDEARILQSKLIQLIEILLGFPFFAALKSILKCKGVSCGPCRLPLPSLSVSQEEELHRQLKQFGLEELLQEEICRPGVSYRIANSELDLTPHSPRLAQRKDSKNVPAPSSEEL